MIADTFDDPTFALARQKAVDYAAMLRRMDELESAHLGLEETEYATLQQVLQKLNGWFKPG